MGTDQYQSLKRINKVINAGPYQNTWESLANREMPRWMFEGKFGIFIHWGVYSVPAFGNEWYPKNMYIQGSREYVHHIKTWGAQNKFGYKDFIPLFTADKFDPSAWLTLFKRAGAKYIVPVAEHHDGFQMYRSSLSRWNSVEMGPKRDVIGELVEETNKQGLVYGVSSHRFEHWFFMGHGREFESDINDSLYRGDLYWPAMPEPLPFDPNSTPIPSEEFLIDWLLRSCEIVDNYHPKLLYFDWWIMHSSAKPYLRMFAAYYYNCARQWGDEVTICYKQDAFAFGTATPDIERGRYENSQPFKWQSDTAIARNSWSWTELNRFKSVREILIDLIDVVSKNGVLLLNVGPRPDGTISKEDETILLGIGQWLDKNGKAIYKTIPWRIFGEGPTNAANSQFSDKDEIQYTSSDIRFTCRGDKLYAIFLKWPENGQAKIRSINCQKALNSSVFDGVITKIEILGYCNNVDWHIYENYLQISKKDIKTELPVVVEITVS